MLFRSIFLLSLLAFSLWAPVDFVWGTRYDSSRDRNYCTEDNFKYFEEAYHREPENPDYQVGYGICRVIHAGDDPSLRELYDHEALAILYRAVEVHKNIRAASFIANYIQTGGDLNFFSTDFNKLNEAIAAHQHVLFLIDRDTSFPERGQIYNEEEYKIELISNHALPLLYYYKFTAGAHGLYIQRHLQSPIYKRSKEELFSQFPFYKEYMDSTKTNTYPDYSPYTLDSLSRTVKFANQCINLPQKYYFDTVDYTVYKDACRILKIIALELQPLQEQRLSILNQEFCEDILDCPEYHELENQISEFTSKGFKFHNSLFGFFGWLVTDEEFSTWLPSIFE